MQMKRIHLLAAELYSYSYDNYENHLGIGNVRFDRLMPEDAKLLEQAEKEGWTDEQIAAQSDFEMEDIPRLRERFKEAKTIIDAESPAEAFFRAVRASVEYAVNEGLDNQKSIDHLTGQICYRAADLSFLLKQRNEQLWEYSKELRSRADDIDDI